MNPDALALAAALNALLSSPCAYPRPGHPASCAPFVASEEGARAVSRAAHEHDVPVPLVGGVCVQESTFGTRPGVRCGCGTTAHPAANTWEDQAQCAARALATHLRTCQNVRPMIARWQCAAARYRASRNPAVSAAYGRRTAATAQSIDNAVGRVWVNREGVDESVPESPRAVTP